MKSRITKAAEKANRSFSDVKIIGASKLQPIEKLELFRSDVYAFAENYVQEFEKKKLALPDVRWHFIGPLQTNKIKKIVGEVDLIHSVGRLQEAKEISKRAQEKKITQNILIEVNIANEATKHGVLETDLSNFLNDVMSLPGIKVTGLMSMPPLSEDPQDNRQYFKKLSELAKKYNLPELSMGTSNDFEVAIEEGATLIRLGEILFGPRPYEKE